MTVTPKQSTETQNSILKKCLFDQEYLWKISKNEKSDKIIDLKNFLLLQRGCLEILRTDKEEQSFDSKCKDSRRSTKIPPKISWKDEKFELWTVISLPVITMFPAIEMFRERSMPVLPATDSKWSDISRGNIFPQNGYFSFLEKSVKNELG